MSEQKYVIDTNILMEYPRVLNEDWEIIIATDVLRELDGLKNNVNLDIAFKARRAAICITRALNKDNITFNSSCEDCKISVDDKLLKIANDKKAILVTNDVYLKVKAIISNIITKGYGGQKDYEGIIEIDCNNYDYNKIEAGEDVVGLKEGQYMKLTDGVNYINTYIKEDNILKKIMPYKEKIRNNICNEIKPKNVEQGCLMNALNNKEKTIISVGGCFGAGKSFICNNFALQEIEKENIRKIVYVPNNAYVEDAMEIGFLPGDMIDKISG